MLFLAPIPFQEAADSHAVRALLPTSMGSAELNQLDAGIRRRAFFSARTLHEGYLDRAKGLIADFVDGNTDVATVRTRLKDYLDAIDYRVSDPEDEDTIKDLRSDRRLDLVIRTNAEQAQGYGSWRQGQDPAILNLWPAQELYRAEGRKAERDWPAIWTEAGGTVQPDGRLIALKDDPIWTAISDFGNPYPPFKFGSGMDVRDIGRDEAMRLGLIDLDTEVRPQTLDFDAPQGEGGDGGRAALPNAADWREEDHPRGAGGKFGSKGHPSVGKTGTAESLGLPKAHELHPASGNAVHRLEHGEAERMLREGFSERDPLGRTVRFGRVAADHRDISTDRGRSRFLAAARQAVKQPAEVWQDGLRQRYIGVFRREDGGVLGHVVVAARVREGTNEVITFIPKKARDLDKSRVGKLLYASHR